jgi:hypothetical protein
MTFAESSKRAGLVLLGLVCACMFATAQTTPPQLMAFTQEYTVPLANIGANVPANIPAATLTAIATGQLEIRQQITFVATGNKLQVETFVVRPGAPNPTPTADQTAKLDSFTVSINTISFGSRPGTNMVIMGTIDSNDESPFGSLTGSPFIYSLGYTAGTPARFNNTTALLPGTATLFVPSSTGTLTFQGGSPGPGPQPGTNKPPVANAGSDITAVVAQVQLDGSGSSDPDGDTLTYSWKSVGRSASINGANTAKPTVQLGEGFGGGYRFELTVSDGKGGTATDIVEVFNNARF